MIRFFEFLCVYYIVDDKIDDIQYFLQNKPPSIAPLDAEHLKEFDKQGGFSVLSHDRDLSWYNGTKNCSKRNSIISNLSIFSAREDIKEEN